MMIRDSYFFSATLYFKTDFKHQVHGLKLIIKLLPLANCPPKSLQTQLMNAEVITIHSYFLSLLTLSAQFFQKNIFHHLLGTPR